MWRHAVWQMSSEVTEKTDAFLFCEKEKIAPKRCKSLKPSVKLHGTTSRNNVILTGIWLEQVHLD
jgi:hypothetical protein